MKRRQILLLFSVAFISCLLVFLLRLVNPAPSYGQSGQLLVSAAASLKDVLEAIRPLYRQAAPNVNLTFNFGASGALLQQIEQGAPADVFISAATRQMDALEQKGALVPGTRGNLANNRLALVVPKNSKAVSGFKSLTTPAVKRVAIGEPRSVPAGQYAEQVLQKLNLWDDIKPKLVYANNVRQVLAAVESGNAEAGMVYVTDARISNRVRVVAIADDNSHSPIVYPMAVLRSSKDIAAAKSFVRYLSSNEAKSVLRKYGFVVPK
ncbi:MAG: molybdate ABC transporter substrate-binding protein [Leptolyngbyaceae cyanobacterium bins.349]|nr:molybdate ABC transporter substrate-binding protein [Leptolyngbyaceae cyanobacterium bins.349]